MIDPLNVKDILIKDRATGETSDAAKVVRRMALADHGLGRHCRFANGVCMAVMSCVRALILPMPTAARCSSSFPLCLIRAA